MSETDMNELFNVLKKLTDLKRDNFVQGKTKIPYALAIYDHQEIFSVVESLLSGWLGLGKNARAFENSFSKFLGIKNCVITNSGSSANLIAVESLKLPAGSEVITPAVTFPTTLNPILQRGLKPVFIDVNPQTYNIEASQLNEAISSNTSLVMLPHTLGNPNEMDVISEIIEDNHLYLIEDACDALGSKYDGKHVSTFGHFGTFSFYPAHHMTMGEGGALVTNIEELALTAKSFRDWGRACVCPVCNISLDPDYHCPLRFNDLPIPNYDRKYTYTNIGYNLKPLDLQAAIGLQQLNRLPDFIKKRKENFHALYNKLKKYEDYFLLPESLPKADPSWFAFPLTVKSNAPFKRKDIISFLEHNKIGTRPLFAGNILKQPAYSDIEYNVVGNLLNSDRVMEGAFFVGVHPGLGEMELSYIADSFKTFMNKVGNGLK